MSLPQTPTPDVMIAPTAGYPVEVSGTISAPADTTAPVATLNLPTTATSLTVAVTLTADETATFYVNQTGVLPAEPTWGAAPDTYSFTAEGSQTLYAWAKDAAGNVSAGVSDTVVITLLTGLFVLPSLSVQPAVSAPSLSGVSIGAFDCPSVSVTPVVAAPSLSGVTSGTAIRAPSATPYVIRNLSGQPVTFRTL